MSKVIVIIGIVLMFVGAVNPCLIKENVGLTKTGQPPSEAVCVDGAIHILPWNGSMHLFYDRSSCSTMTKPEVDDCKPQCNLVLHKMVCPDGRLCPIADLSPPSCSKSRFACTQYSAVDLKRALDICESDTDTVRKCSGSCRDRRATYSMATGRCNRQAASETNLNLAKQLHLPLQNIEFDIQNDDDWKFQDDVYVRTYASSEEIFEALESSLFDPYVILFREFNPCLNDLIHSSRHTTFLYLPAHGTLFEFGVASSSPSSNNATSQVSICTVAGDDSRFVVGKILMIAGFVLSLAGLLLTIISVFLTGQNRHIPGMNLLCLSFSLIVAYLTVVVVNFVRGLNEPCLPEGILHVIGILASLAWMNVMAFDIWNTLSKMYVDDVASGRKLFCYCVYGWGLPAAILLVGVLADHLPSVPPTLKPRFSLGQCWFYMGFNTWGTVIFYYGPIAVIMAVNLILFLLTVRILFQSHLMQSRMSDETRMHQKIKCQFKLYLKLFLVMGLTWGLEVTNLFLPVPEVFIVSDFVNTLQGFFIFVIFVCKPHVFKVFSYYCCPRRFSSVSKEDLRKSARKFSCKSSIDATSFQAIKLGVCTRV